MNDVFHGLQVSFPWLIEYRYLLIFLAACIEGFSTMMVAGFLLSTRSVSLVPTFLVLVAGEIANGFLWYAVGYWGGGRAIDWLLRHSRRQRQLVDRVRAYMERYTGQAILFAKMTFSVTVLTQVLVGSTKYPTRRFAIFNIIGSIGWVALILALGFFFGTGYTAIFGYLKSFSHLLLFVVITVVVVLLFGRLFRGALMRYLGFFALTQRLTERIKALNRFMTGQGPSGGQIPPEEPPQN